MKALRWILILVLCPALLLNVKAGDPNWATIAPTPQIHSEMAESFSFKHASLAMSKNDYDPCKEYKRREIAGFVLFPVGLGLAGGGGYMVYKGVTDISNNVSNINVGDQQGPYVPKHDIVLVSVGTAMSIVGLVLVPTGLSMGIRGAVRYRKHCSGGSRSYYIGPSDQGTGLACRF